MKSARILSFGSFLPNKVMRNQEFEAFVDTSDEWITSRTGIKERRFISDGETTSSMGACAAQKAIDNAGISKDAIECIIVVTSTSDKIMPTTAALIQASLGIKDVPVMDVNAACSGYLYGLLLAKSLIESNIYTNVLLVASDSMSPFIDFTDRTTCILFGDGAAASVISGEGRGFLIQVVALGADGTQADILEIPAGGSKEPASTKSVEAHRHYIRMEGREVFKHAVRRMSEIGKTALQLAHLTIEDIDFLVPHQANIKIIQSLAKSFGVSLDKVGLTIHKYGNTSAGSVGITLDELCQEEEISAGSHLLLLAFGAGLTYGAAILKKEDI